MDHENPQKSKQDEVICINCGAKLTFAPGTESLSCEFCGAENKIEVDESVRQEAIKEIDFHEFLRQGADTSAKIEVSTISCDGCGASTTFDPNVVSDTCDFCDNPLVAANAHTSSVIQPKAMLPFKVKDKEGQEMFKNWLKKLWFAPNKLKTYAKSDKLAGIYTPYWTYDADTYTSYSGERGVDYEVTTTDSDGNETSETRTDWSYVSGRVSRFFDDVMVPASKTLPQKLVHELEPWDLENLVPYDTKYLSGFKSETYQVGLEDGYGVAQNKMEPTIVSDIKGDIGGDRQRISSKSTSYNDITFKHVLLPIWLSAYRFNDKVYRFMINGRTGEVQGERPWSWIKITLAVLAVLAVIGTIYFFAKDS